MARCDELATYTEEPGRITRRFLSDPMRAVHGRLGGWLQAVGVESRIDAVGNLIGRRPASSGKRTLLIGSHLDTVPHAGRYDGTLGVLLGLAVIEALGDTPLPFNVDLIGFSEEEGVRFSKPYLGSAAIAGCFREEWLTRQDSAGVTMQETISRFGGRCEEIAHAAYRPEDVIGFIEPHLEQGPVLERAGSPVGVVSGIVGQSRLRMEIVGEAGHAGTTPMNCRRDALVAAAGLVSEVRRIADETPHLHATVGQLQVVPNAPNVIPERINLSLDVRHPDDGVREQAVEKMIAAGRRFAEAEGDSFAVVEVTHQSAVSVDESLTAALSDTIAEGGAEPLRLSSGAGHDAVMMAQRFPTAMLFLRHPGGVSHHPDEQVDREDVAVAIEVLTRFVARLATQTQPTTPVGAPT